MPYRGIQTSAIAHRDRMGRWILIGTLALWGVWGWGVRSVPALPVEYFAVGDSVASGRGLDDDETACRQSRLAYPWLVVERLQETFLVQQFDLLACSGATTATLDQQVSEVLSRLSVSPTLLTLTIGANDFGWSDVFAFAPRLCTPSDEAFRAWVGGTAQVVEENLVGQLSRVLAYPQVEVILTDYYNPTNASGAFWERVHPRCLLVDVYDRSEQVVHALNAAIRQALSASGAPVSYKWPRCTPPSTAMRPRAPGVARPLRTSRGPGSSTRRIPTRIPPRWAAIASTRTALAPNNMPRP